MRYPVNKDKITLLSSLINYALHIILFICNLKLVAHSVFAKGLVVLGSVQIFFQNILGGTRTDRAIEMAENELMCPKCGTRSGASKALLVITDGIPSRQSKPMNEVTDQLKVSQFIFNTLISPP